MNVRLNAYTGRNLKQTNKLHLCCNISSSSITCRFQSALHSPTTEKIPPECLSRGLKTHLCPSCLLRLLCTDPQSNLSHWGIVVHVNVISFSSCMARAPSPSVQGMELFAWLWNYSLRGNMASFIPDQFTRSDINLAAEVPQEPPSTKCQLPLDSPMKMT